MKTLESIYAMSAIAGLALLSSCAKENVPVEADTYTFSIEAAVPQTKTVFDGGTYAVEWEASDELGVVISDGTTQTLYKFTKGTGANDFVNGEFVPEEGTEYTYYVVYPYNENLTVTDGKSSPVIEIASGTQAGLDDAGHIKTPLYGSAMATGTAAPSVALKHLASVMKIHVDNYTGAALTVSGVSLESVDEAAVMSGTFAVDFATGELTPAETSNTSSAVALESKTIADGAGAYFYVAVAPFATTKGFSMKVTTGNNVYEFDKINEKYDFAAGQVYRTSVFCGNPGVLVTKSDATTAALSLTPENNQIYADEINMPAGKISLQVNLDGTNLYLCPKGGVDVTVPDNDLVDNNPQGVEFDAEFVSASEAAAGWNLPVEGDWRIIVDMARKKVKFYSPKNKLEPLTVNFEYGGSTGWILSKTISDGSLYIRTNCGWDQWTGKPFNFVTSQVDPYILVGTSITIPEGKSIIIRTGIQFADGFSVIKEGPDKDDAANDPENKNINKNDPTGRVKNIDFASKIYSIAPVGTTDMPLIKNEWMPMTQRVHNKTWTFSETLPLTINRIIIDLRNNKIRFEY